LPCNENCILSPRNLGDRILAIRENAEHTYAFVGYDPRKVSIHDPAVVLDARGNEIGVVLTCVSDMAIARYDGRIYSMASPDKPENFKPLGLSCGFVKVKPRLVAGQEVHPEGQPPRDQGHDLR
jgi:aminomethyltransferase